MDGISALYMQVSIALLLLQFEQWQQQQQN